MDRSTVERVAAVAGRPVSGRFYRHAAPNRDAFAGGTDGRWGARFAVIYLADSEAAAIVEAYRHLVEADGVPAARVRPRTLYVVRVDAHDLLDLTDPDDLERVGLTSADLTSEVDNYDHCQQVAAAAHQLGRHGVLAPAAHGLGLTLALFRERIASAERPVVERTERWEHLPTDPRTNDNVVPLRRLR